MEGNGKRTHSLTFWRTPPQLTTSQALSHLNPSPFPHVRTSAARSPFPHAKNQRRCRHTKQFEERGVRGSKPQHTHNQAGRMRYTHDSHKHRMMRKERSVRSGLCGVVVGVSRERGQTK